MLPELLTRNDLRELGLKVTNTTFQRWEKPDKQTGRPALLHPIKPGGGRSALVFYRRDEVERLLQSRSITVKAA